MPGRVTPTQRKYAERLDRERSRLDRMGTRAAVRHAVRLRAAVTRTYRQGGNVAAVIQEQSEGLRGLITDAMAAAHLLGRRRVLLSAERARRKVKLSIFDDAIDDLQRRLNMSDGELTGLGEIYGPEVSKVLGTMQRDLQSRVGRAASEAIEQGLSTRAGVDHIRKAMTKAGVTPEKDYLIEQIFRTQTQVAYSAGRWNQLRSPDIDEILWGFKYVTVGDDRVRVNHAALDGATLPKDHPFWRRAFPPNGYNCRCTAIELFEPEEETELPGTVEVDGAQVVPEPDRGWSFNLGELHQDLPAQHGGSTPPTGPITPAAPPDPPEEGKALASSRMTVRASAVSEAVIHTLTVIDRVHDVPGDVPVIPHRANVPKKAIGVYRYASTGKPISIGVKKRGPWKHLTTAHEFGHFMDHQDIDGNRGTWTSHGAIDEVMAIIEGSQAVTELNRRLLPLSRSSKMGEYLRYALQRDELFARSYAQFIATESADEKLLADLNRVRDNSVVPTQWDDADFAPIAEAMRQMFRERGLLK